ncbi:putative uncharacterized protein [Waddlia chondrophila 2032/99]|uniref:Uncharacterized protein n=1 Tax=Waddlia chondrophila 2032/99 TaxID=765953 RepID=F8LD40_9BACT|nr:putative uncharacterized protein [Waddlia chondrophila 2032/99]
MLQVPLIASSHDYLMTVSRKDLCPLDYQVKVNLLERVWKAFLKILRNFLRYFSLSREAMPFDLSKRQIGLIQKAREVRVGSSPLASRAVVPRNVAGPIEEIAETRIAEHDPTLEKLKEFLQKFSGIAVNDCAYQETISPRFPEWKEALTTLVKEIPDWNETLIKLKESLTPLMNGVKKADDPAITLIIQQLLKHYIQLDKKTVKTELLENLENQKLAGNIDEIEFERTVAYLDPVLSWLYHPNNWVVQSAQPVNLHNFISDSFRFLDTLSAKIRNGDLNVFFKNMISFIENDFENSLKQAFEHNTSLIARLFSNRLADLIEHLPYSETYADILRKIVEHMEGWISANEMKKEQERLVDDAIKANNAHATSVSEIDRQRTAQEFLDFVREDGGRDNYLHKEFLHKFSQHEACHDEIKKIIDSDSPEEAEKIKKKAYENMVELLFPIFLPDEKQALPHGLETKVNGISSVLGRLIFPEKIEMLKNEAMRVFEEILTASEVKDPENFRVYFYSLIHMIAVQYVQTKTKSVLASELQKLMTRLSTKEYLDYLAVEYIFPSLIRKTLEGFVRAHIERKSNEIAIAFYEMFNQDQKIDLLLESLYQSVCKNLIDFNMDEAEIGFSEFESIVKPILLEIHDFIENKRRESGDEMLSLNQVKNDLNEYLKWETVPVNHDYGKLIMHALFKIGSFGGWFSEKLIGWFQGTLSETTSQTMHPISNHYKLLVDSIVETASQNFLSVEFVKEYLFSEELSVEEKRRQKEKVERDLPKQIRRISALAHDTIYRSLEARSIPFIKYSTPKTENIETIIQNVFTRIFGDEKLNESLFLSSVEIIGKSFQSSVQRIE